MSLRQGLTVPSEGQCPTPHDRYHYIRVNGQENELGQQMESPLCLGLGAYTLGHLCPSLVKVLLTADAGVPDKPPGGGGGGYWPMWPQGLPVPLSTPSVILQRSPFFQRRLRSDYPSLSSLPPQE